MMNSVLVTGASKGIGREIALRLGASGWRVAVHFGEDKAGANEVAGQLREACIGVFSADLAEKGEADHLWEQVTGIAEINALVNNAGIYQPHSFLETSPDEFEKLQERMFAINFFSPLALSRKAASFFNEKGGGKILNIASRVGFRGEANASLYAASKAALINLTRSLAVELSSKNIQVFGLAPGWVETAMSRDGMETRLPQILKDIPLGRMASPQDCANVAEFLLRPESSYLSGITIDINGASYFH